jgi:hypothetical protein
MDHEYEMWHDTLRHMWPQGVYWSMLDFRVDGEDNSVEMAIQQTVERFMPEQYSGYNKPTIIIGA